VRINSNLNKILSRRNYPPLTRRKKRRWFIILVAKLVVAGPVGKKNIHLYLHKHKQHRLAINLLNTLSQTHNRQLCWSVLTNSLMMMPWREKNFKQIHHREACASSWTQPSFNAKSHKCASYKTCSLEFYTVSLQRIAFYFSLLLKTRFLTSLHLWQFKIKRFIFELKFFAQLIQSKELNIFGNSDKF